MFIFFLMVARRSACLSRRIRLSVIFVHVTCAATWSSGRVQRPGLLGRVQRPGFW